jgi:hypothetical protein
MENFPGSETGSGQDGTQGKATEDRVNAFAFEWDRAGNSSKHIAFLRRSRRGMTAQV